VRSAKKNYAQGELQEILKPSEIRVTPRCPAFGSCGGCQWQHLPYELQWRTKRQGLLKSLARAGVATPSALEDLPAKQVWEYRNRVQARGFRKQLGFFAEGSRELVAVDRCDIARSELNAEWESVRTEGASRAESYQVELEVDVAGRVHRSWNAGHAARGFRQVNDEQNAVLQSWVRGALTPGERLLDLFGGAGNLSAGLTDLFQEIECVDVTSPTECSRPGYRFHRQSTRAWLTEAAKNPAPASRSAILDPPREGLGDDFDAIHAGLVTLGVREVIAVGCDPDAWARDVSRFVRGGWRLDRIAALDLFPQTPHIESLARLILPSDHRDLSGK
jgi:tRNA/tmRNA/rRNA uracil-C5-methylase (TrmA/RlmC/RlmD family)